MDYEMIYASLETRTRTKIVVAVDVLSKPVNSALW